MVFVVVTSLIVWVSIPYIGTLAPLGRVFRNAGVLDLRTILLFKTD